MDCRNLLIIVLTLNVKGLKHVSVYLFRHRITKIGKSMARSGIEPETYRFSVYYSTTELPSLSARNGIRTHDENNLDGLKVRYPSL